MERRCLPGPAAAPQIPPSAPVTAEELPVPPALLTRGSPVTAGPERSRRLSRPAPCPAPLAPGRQARPGSARRRLRAGPAEEGRGRREGRGRWAVATGNGEGRGFLRGAELPGTVPHAAVQSVLPGQRRRRPADESGPLRAGGQRRSPVRRPRPGRAVRRGQPGSQCLPALPRASTPRSTRGPQPGAPRCAAGVQSRRGWASAGQTGAPVVGDAPAAVRALSTGLGRSGQRADSSADTDSTSQQGGEPGELS